MKDSDANKIVFGILLFIIAGIAICINTLTGLFDLDLWVNRMRNNSGEISAYVILMWVLAATGIYFMIHWIFFAKPHITQLLTPSPPEI
jgi:glucan phosphoethanolaminetransferase (alkaline phosphatase superfamily)